MTLHDFWTYAVQQRLTTTEEMVDFAQAHRSLYKDDPSLPRPVSLKDWIGSLEAWRSLKEILYDS